MARGRRSHVDNDGAIGCVVYMMLAIFAMPLVGLYLLCAGRDEQKGLGIALIVIGIIIWAVMGMY